MIYDEVRKIGEYNQAGSSFPDISPLRYDPSVTTTGHKANIGEM